MVNAHVFCQKKVIDSLENLLYKTELEETTKVKVYAELAWKYMVSDPAKAKEYTEKGLELSEQLNYPVGITLLLNRLGDYYFRQGEYAKGVEIITEALKTAEQHGDSLGMANSYRFLGIIHTYGLKQYDKALEFHFKALPIYVHQDSRSMLAAIYSNITWVYASINKKLDEADSLTDKAIKLSKELKDDLILSWCYNSKGLIFLNRGEIDSAEFYINLSNDFAVKENDQAVLAYNKTILGEINLLKDESQKAISFFKEALDNSKPVNVREVTSAAYRGLYKCYLSQKKYAEALHYHLQYTALRDSLQNIETTQRVAVIQAEYEKASQVARITLLEKEKELAENKTRNYIILFGTGTFALLIVLGLILRNNALSRKANHILKEKNEEIATQNEELQQSREEIAAQRDLLSEQNIHLREANDTKEKLFAIIGHDMRGPIVRLKELLSLVTREIVTEKEFKELAPQLNKNVGNIQDTLENLLKWSDSQMKGIKTNLKAISLKDVVPNTLDLFAEAASAKGILLKNEISENISILADIDQFKLILRNLINNAIKFTPHKGQISISAEENSEYVDIAISDTGVGIPNEKLETIFEPNAHFSTYGTEGEKGTGLGLMLCKEMVENNNGKIWATSKIDEGSTFTIRLRNA